MNESDCEVVRMSVMAMADGETPPLTSEQVQAHLQHCELCKESVASSQTALILCDAQRQQHKVDLWPAIHAKWSSRHDQRVGRASMRVGRFSWLSRAVAVAAGILLVVGAVWWQGEGNSGPMRAKWKVSTTLIDVAALVYEIPHKSPPPLSVEEYHQKYSVYFEPDFQTTQGERVPPDLDVDTLQSVYIRDRNGDPQLGTLFINREGVVVLAIKAPWVQRPFSEGLAAVDTADGTDGSVQRFGFVDRTGAMVIPPNFDGTEPFHEGLAPIKVGEKWGFIDRQGTIVLKPQYHFVEAFQNGIARVHLMRQDPNDVTFDDVHVIDRQGNVRFKTKSRDTGSFSEGLMFANIEGVPGVDVGRAVGYMDSTFSFAFRLGTDSSGFAPHRCEEFHDGMAAVEVEGSNQWGFIDRGGRLAVPGPFFQVRPFSEGLAAVARSTKNDALWGYIDRTGSFVIGERFFKVTSFSDGLAAVLLPFEEADAPKEQPGKRALPKVKWGYIDQQGQTVIEPRFYAAKPFYHGLAEVQESPRHVGFIDKSGNYVWEMILPGVGDDIARKTPSAK